MRSRDTAKIVPAQMTSRISASLKVIVSHSRAPAVPIAMMDAMTAITVAMFFLMMNGSISAAFSVLI